MPIVKVETVGHLSKQQKQELIQKLTAVVVEVTKKPAQYVYVRVEEVEGQDFGIGGEPLA